MAFPTTGVLDTFVRANEMPLGQANWKDVIGVQVVSNLADRDNNAAYVRSFYNTTFGPNCDAFLFIPTIDKSAHCAQGGLYARYDPTGVSGYIVDVTYEGGGGADHILLVEETAGSGTVLHTYHVTLADGEGVGIRCHGNDISVYRYTGGAWSLLGTTVDATHTGAGLCGMYVFPASGTLPTGVPLNDFGAGNETGAAFPEPGVVDDFDRADEGPPPSSAWVDQYVIGVVSNQGAPRQMAGSAPATYWELWRAAFAQDQEVFVTTPVRPADEKEAYVVARWVDVTHFLSLVVARDDAAGDVVVLMENNGSYTSESVAGWTITYQDEDSFGLVCIGASVQVWYKAVGGSWVQLGSGSPGLAAAGGCIGMFTSSTATRFSNFGGGDYSEEPPPPPPPPTPQTVSTVVTSSFGLLRGLSFLSLVDGRYSVQSDFAPPGIAISAQIAAGSATNYYGGGDLVGRKFNNRALTFSVQVSGTSEADVRRGISDLQDFLLCAVSSAPEMESTYLSYRPNPDVTLSPIWGQHNAPYLYEIITAFVTIGPLYGSAKMRECSVVCVVTLSVKPFALGIRQKMCLAKGGVYADTFFAPANMSRGVVVCPAIDNYFTNPIFGNATWDTGWTAGAGIDASKIINPSIVPFGSCVALLSMTGPAGNTFLQSVDSAGATDHVLSCFIRMPDGSAPVPTTDVQLVYGSTAYTPTIYAVGNGWYRAYVVVTGTGAPANGGVRVNNYRTFYVAGFQFEASDSGYPTVLAWGDLYGCSWDSTSHASATARAAGQLVLALDSDIFSPGAGSIEVVWRAGVDSAFGNEMELFATSTGLRAYLTNGASDMDLVFTDGTYTLTVAGLDFDIGDTFAFHFTWSASRLNVYVNGALAATYAAYASAGAPSYLYIGTDDAGTSVLQGAIQSFAIYGAALSAAECLADYTNLLPVVEGERELEATPFLWTDDGDGVLETGYDDSHCNVGIIDGVPGGVPAITEILAVTSIGAYASRLFWSAPAYSRLKAPPIGALFLDESGEPDATCFGGEYNESASFDDSGAQINTTVALSAQLLDAIMGRDLIYVVRLRDNGAALYLSAELAIDYTVLASEYRPVESAAYMSFIRAPGLIIPTKSSMFVSLGLIPSASSSVVVRAKRAVGESEATVEVDCVDVMPRPFCIIGIAGGGVFIYSGRRACVCTAALEYVEEGQVVGDTIEFAPGLVNYFQSICFDLRGSSISHSVGYLMWVTPRYALL